MIEKEHRYPLTGLLRKLWVRVQGDEQWKKRFIMKGSVENCYEFIFINSGGIYTEEFKKLINSL